MTKRKTKEQYIKIIKGKAKLCNLTIKGNLSNREKIILSSRISLYHPVCGKTRNCTVSSFLKYPDCQYCNKVSRNEELIARRAKVYKAFPKPKKGISPVISIPPRLAKKVGKLSVGKLITNGKATKGETLVAAALFKLKVNYTVEHKIWLNVHSKTPLRADFCVPLDGINYLIEYDGEQHFRAIGKYGGRRRYYRTLSLDEAKDRFVRTHSNYKILRIPYWEIENIEYHIRKYLPL